MVVSVHMGLDNLSHVARLHHHYVQAMWADRSTMLPQLRYSLTQIKWKEMIIKSAKMTCVIVCKLMLQYVDEIPLIAWRFDVMCRPLEWRHLVCWRQVWRLIILQWLCTLASSCPFLLVGMSQHWNPLLVFDSSLYSKSRSLVNINYQDQFWVIRLRICNI